MKIGEFFVEYNRLLILGAVLTVLLMATLLGNPAAATVPGSGSPV